MSAPRSSAKFKVPLSPRQHKDGAVERGYIVGETIGVGMYGKVKRACRKGTLEAVSLERGGGVRAVLHAKPAKRQVATMAQ